MLEAYQVESYRVFQSTQGPGWRSPDSSCDHLNLWCPDFVAFFCNNPYINREVLSYGEEDQENKEGN